jgi:predicted dithiol-disulfide oxidoreductase (DUF899 family)
MTAMTKPQVVPRSEWLRARLELLEREKAFDKERDALSAARRALPWVHVEQPYEFQDLEGPVSLEELFDGASQLVVQHFMFGPEWEAGCPHCSFWADGFDRLVTHLAQRDVAFAAVSRAPISRLDAYRKRMGWKFRWVSSLGNRFNFHFAVSATDEEMAQGTTHYNYQDTPTGSLQERPGMSVFAKNDEGIFHTYSTFARGLDRLNVAYQVLDMVPRGRAEEGLPYPQAWVRRHDEYED